MSNIVVSSVIEDFMDSATAAEARTAIGAGTGGSGVWGSITGTLSAQTDLQAALDAKQPLDGPVNGLNLESSPSGGAIITNGSTFSFTGSTATIDFGSGGSVLYEAVTTIPDGSTNGVTWTIANRTTTPTFTFSLGDIVPSSVNGNTISTGIGTLSLNNALVTFSASADYTFSGTGTINLIDSNLRFENSIIFASDGTGTRTLNINAGGTLASMAFQAATAVNIDGGTIDGTVIGGATPAAATVTLLTASSSTNEHFFTLTRTGTLTEQSINAGAILHTNSGGASGWRFLRYDFNAFTNNAEMGAVAYGQPSQGAPYDNNVYLASSDLSGVAPYSPTTLIPIRLIQYGAIGATVGHNWVPLELDAAGNVNFWSGRWESKEINLFVKQGGGVAIGTATLGTETLRVSNAAGTIFTRFNTNANSAVNAVGTEQVLSFFNAAAVTRAWQLGSNAVGGGVGEDFVLSIYNGSAWSEKLRVTNAGALSVPGVSALSGGIVGKTDASNATAGNVGETISSLVAIGSAVSLTTATPANVTSISLTAGDWWVQGLVSTTETVATASARSAGINTTSATIPTDGSQAYCGVQSTLVTEINSITLPWKRVNVSSTTTVYLCASATFSAGTVAAFGSLIALRASR